MSFSNCGYLFSVLFISCLYLLLHVSTGIDTITSASFIKDPETLISKDGNFTLGFFSSKNSTNRYVGIWWKSQSTIIWVANRNQPLNDYNGIVTISEDGNLVILNGQKRVYWSSNVSNTASNTTSQFSDFGNLVLLESTTRNILWQSIQQPSDTLLPSMKLSIDKRTGKSVNLKSWKSRFDPSVGIFSSGTVERQHIIEVFIWKETQPHWRSGPWNGGVFTGIQAMTVAYFFGFQGGDDGEGNIIVYYTIQNDGEFVFYHLNSEGILEETRWDDEKKEVRVTWTSRDSACDVYSICGAFSSCSSLNSPICSCLRGFEPRNILEWNRNDWTGGCVRRTPLQCERVNNKTKSRKEDGFLKLQMIKVPDFAQGSTVTPDICRSLCLENCSCLAYSHDDGIGCMSWTRNLLDIQQLQTGGLDLYVRVANAELDRGRNKTIIIISTTIIGTLVIFICAYIIWRRRSNQPARLWHFINSVRENNSKPFQLSNKCGAPESYTSDNRIGEMPQGKLQELLIYDFEKLATATNSFHLSNKLGQGGFGTVYKGKLQDGQEIAVKRLSSASRQGLEEFMNEVVVICKLQHRNLVRLLGCCIEGDEKLLMYEYMPNKSLDAFIFDPFKNKLLDWRTRYSIIEGIARGLLYLHRDSRLRIIHRDLKASNVLLDEELNPKISDFGMARIFGGGEDQVNTCRIVGTYGYMSPEYAMQGLFSEKSDVFSFGVLLLEIVTGKRNSNFYDNEHGQSLLGFIWTQWMENNILSLIDPEIYDSSHHNYILRHIHIGLLCVQELAADRPSMAAVISMLNSEAALSPPSSKPAFILMKNLLNSKWPEECQSVSSINNVSVTDVCGR
ncbi:G-type lectin S-receptor-like serine/threonine-protein kinase At1g11300 [Vicia villosa]|uniref:G-type lectin S-receptor-like serine/threonine-protein kinase At1g11300 n=1 Tax=Vicia villosa TaxID=3911 RepID=UPI00273BA493|nr:G-type lectin S-receptor-like serine/threonine-protein kinase At1g11300 [Vicia villosa]